MFLEKLKFNGKWKTLMCIHCGKLDCDEYLFNCSRYEDLIIDGLHYEWVFSLKGDEETLHKQAKLLTLIYVNLRKFMFCTQL